MSQVPPDLQKVYAHIDENIDAHVENLQKWIRQPSISNSGEGIPESAEMVKGFFDELGCQQTRVFDVGVTEYGSPGNPVVYAKCDEGAEKTLLIYWMYDTMPVTQPDAWTSPPFEARLVEQAPYKKVLIGRGATNSKGPQMSQLNALRAIKAVHGKLPVNVIFVAEGDEERMDIGLRKFVKDHSDLLGRRRRDAALRRPVEQRRRQLRRRLGRLRLRRADDERQVVGPRPDPVRHSRLEQAQRRQPGVAPHQDARVAGVGRRQHAEDRGLLRGHAADREIPGSGVEDGGGAYRSEGRRRERRRRALHLRRSVHDAQDAALRHVVQSRRHLGRQHVCGRRRRDAAEQDHLEAQLPLRPEHDRARTSSRSCARSSTRTATRTSK